MTMSKTVSTAWVGPGACVWLGCAVIQALPIVASAQIAEIVVTTRRKEESLQDVPIAVAVITSEQIQRQGITDLKDVVANQPSVQFDQSFGPSDNRITIRGLSNTRGRSSVAFLVDGIDVTTENLINAGSGLLANRRLLNDVDRIEVVKGPQSALFGRSAFAGAISYTTKDPGDEFNGNVGFDIGDYGRRTVTGVVGGPLTDTFGVRLTGVQFNEDGFYQNSLSGADVGGSDGYGAALTMLWRPADAIRVRTRLEYSEENADIRAVVNLKGDTAYRIPEEARKIQQPFITGNPLTQKAASSATNLFNFGTFCPKFGFDPNNIKGPPAFCLPGVVKNAGGVKVALSEDENTGKDFTGTTASTFFGSLIASIDLGYGTLSSYTGWTDFDASDSYDQDYQASTALDFNGNGSVPYSRDADGKLTGRLDTLMGQNESNQDTSTKQYSQEFRFATQWEGPLQLTGGVLLWRDERRLYDRNNITFCAPYGRVGASPLLDSAGNVVTRIPAPGAAPVPVLDPTTGTLTKVAGICDGTGPNRGTNTSWQDYRRQVSNPQYAATWDARTRDVSFYARLDYELTEDLTLTLEDRFVNETFSLSTPGNSSCTESAFATGNNPTSTWPVEDRTLCDIERIVFNQQPGTILDPATGGLTQRYQEGSSSSNYNTPKVTLAWNATDDTNLFFSYGQAKKPAGINQLAGGGGAEPPSLEDQRFDSEELVAWEVGIKTNFEGAGFWNVNSSIFLQDYSQKQIGIQVVSEEGISQPRIVNVEGTEVWGFEFEVLWQPAFMEGLTLGLAGTLLDATFTDFVDDTRNLVRAAVYGSCPVIYKLGDQESTNPGDFPSTGAVPVAFCRLDYSGNELERSPKQSYSSSLALQRPFLDTPFEYLVELNGSWQDERWADPENVVKLADYARLDMRLGLTSEKWDVVAYMDNVFDDDRFLTGGAGPDFGEQVTQLGFTAGFGTTHYFATLPDPRVIGVRGTYRFGEGR